MEISQIIQQDLKAVLLAARDDDYRLMNIYANRIMMDATFDKKANYAMLGFFLKEIAKMCGGIKTSKDTTAYATAKSFAISYIESIDIQCKSEKLWSDYTAFYNKIRKYQQDEYERESYEDSPEFTRMSFNWLLNLANADKQLLFNPANQIIPGITNEMDRIIRTYGGELRENCLVCLFKALTLYSGYLSYFEKDFRDQTISNSILPYIDLITKTCLEKINLDHVTDILGRIVFDWRISYVKFLERPSMVPVEEPKAEITEETKKRLSKSIEKALEEEVK